MGCVFKLQTVSCQVEYVWTQGNIDHSYLKLVLESVGAQASTLAGTTASAKFALICSTAIATMSAMQALHALAYMAKQQH